MVPAPAVGDASAPPCDADLTTRIPAIVTPLPEGGGRATESGRRIAMSNGRIRFDGMMLMPDHGHPNGRFRDKWYRLESRFRRARRDPDGHVAGTEPR